MLVSYFALLTILATGGLAVDTKVLNGEPATPHQFPYHVGLYWVEKGMPASLATYYSGGALVSDKWVLTAVQNIHIVNNDVQIVVKAGKHIVDQREDSEQVRIVVRYIIHPEYKRPSATVGLIAQNDIAMLKVNIAFTFNMYVHAAEIPSDSAYFLFGSLAGWGSTSMESYVPNLPKELHYNKYLPVVDARACGYAINEVLSNTAFSSIKINSNQVCSGSVGVSIGACFLDRGSAFVNKVGDKYVVIGIVSWNYWLCGEVPLPTIYTRVGAYSEWINKVMQSS